MNTIDNNYTLYKMKIRRNWVILILALFVGATTVTSCASSKKDCGCPNRI